MKPDNSRINWKHTLIRVLLFCIGCALILILFSPLTRHLPNPWSDIALGSMAIGAIFILTVVFTRWEKLTLKDVGVIPTRRTFWKFLFGFAIGILLALAQGGLVIVFGNVKLIYAEHTSHASVLSTLLLYLILAVREELAFRGYALRSLAYSVGSWKAQLIIAAVFALEHLAGGYTVTQAFLGAGIGAILFGIAALKSKGIALPIGIHAAWNFGQWSIGFKNEPGIWQAYPPDGYAYQEWSLVFYLLVMGIAIAGFYFYKRKN